MLRHAIAPARAFAQIPNAILRHPRLSSDAKTLLNWQLSLPPGDRQCLSDTARRAGIGKCAFQNAKRQLRDEGYLHEWRKQAGGGRFVTVQLVSNAPLSTKEALAVRDGLRPTPGGARLSRDAGEGRPSARNPAAGEPTGPPVGRPPEKNTGENTTQPTGPAREPADEPPQAPTPEPPTGGQGPEESAQVSSAGLAAAETLLLSLGRLDPQLSLPVGTARNWAPLAAKWLDSGLSALRIRHALTEGLETARKPLGALRWRLEHALPEAPPTPVPVPETTSAKPEPRTSRMRECRTRHTQPRLFTPPPGGDEGLCPDCRVLGRRRAEPLPPPTSTGYAAFRTARQARHSSTAADRPTP
ncbi:hypothetical protein N566_16100 [Streptomycetaceae bacterium MP113-05]|nr:hypothetical protein N566_16100 [Streptomycetaceae bacterium MP113-05]